MHITRLAVKGFRSLKDVVWEPGKLNVLIGPNGGGKTNLLKVLDMLSVSARGGLAKWVQHQGGMEPLVWDGSASRVEIESEYKGNVDESFRYQLAIWRLPGSASYSIRNEILDGTLHTERGKESLRLIERTSSSSSFRSSNEELKKLGRREMSSAQTILSMLNSPLVGGADEAWAFGSLLSSSAIYEVVDTKPMREPVVVSLDKSVESDGANLIAALHTANSTDRHFKREIDLAMKAAFGDEFEELVFPPAADQRIQLRIRWKSLKREQSSADLSDGTLRFLFLLTVLGAAERPGLIAIEEPETGLHPSMLPIVAEFAAEASRESQVVFTTHSPAFLDAIGKEDVRVTVVESEDGKTNLRNLSGDSLKYWLDQFTLGQVYRSGQLESLG